MTTDTNGRSDARTPYSHPLCKVCTSERRRDIECALLTGRSRASVADQFSSDTVSFNRQNLHTHFWRHMHDVDEAVARAAAEERQRRRLDPATVVSVLAKRRQLLSDLLEEGLEAVTDGGVRWTVRDVISVSNELAELENIADHDELGEVMREARIFAGAVQAVVPEQQWQLIGERFEELAKGSEYLSTGGLTDAA